MNENLGNILADNAEVILDNLIENEVLKEIPVIGTSINIIKGIKNIRDVGYLNKLKTFMTQLGEIDDDKRERLISESKKDEKRRAKFGNAIFTAVEQSDSLIKVKYLAVAFEGFLNGDYNSSDFRLMCHTVSNAFTDDLIDIIEEDEPNSELKYLVPTGLADPVYGDLLVSSTRTEPNYELSMTSMQLREAWRRYKTE